MSKASGKVKVEEKRQVESMEVEEGEEEEEEEEETEDFGPDFNPQYFAFLTREKPEEFFEGQFDLNRPFRAALGFLDNPHGSVKLYQGDTCAICAVYGPSEVRMAKELPHRAGVDVLFRPKITGISQLSQLTGWDGTLEERAVEIKLTSILESVIFLEDDMGSGFNVILNEFENDGSLFSTCVNASALALLNAGCSLRCTFAAVSVLLSKSNSLIIDPSQSQISNGWEAHLTFVFSNDGKVLYAGLEGKATPKLIHLSMVQAKKASEEIFRFQRLVQFKECSSFAGKIAIKQEKVEGDNLDGEGVIDLENMKLEEDDDEDFEDIEDDGGSEEEEGEVVEVSSGGD